MMKEFEHFADMIKVLINGGEEGFTAENFSAAALGNKFYDNKVMAEKFVEAITAMEDDFAQWQIEIKSRL